MILIGPMTPAGVISAVILSFSLTLCPRIALAESTAAITALDWQRDAGGPGLVATLELSGTCSPERIRLLLDVDGASRGESRIGGDFMVEGPHLYQHAGAGDWSWKPLGAAATILSSNRLAVHVSPFPATATVRVVAEITGEDWTTRSRFPEHGVSSFKPADLPAVDWFRLTGATIDPSLDLLSAKPFRSSAGGIGFLVTVGGNPDVSRIRILIDTNGTSSGWSDYGIDVMSEGALTFCYPEMETEWRWNSLGEVISAVESNTIVIVLPDIHIPGDFRWYVETFNTNWDVIRRFPAQGVMSSTGSVLSDTPALLAPPPPDMSALLSHTRLTLSRRFVADYQNKPWRAVSTPLAFPRISVPGSSETAEFYLEYVDGRSGHSQRLNPERVEQAGDSTRWSGRIDEQATWSVFLSPGAPGEIDIVGAVESVTDRCFRITAGLTYPGAAWTWHDDVAFSEKMDGGSSYMHDYASPYGLTQRRSYYPFAVISSPDAILIAETDGREPRQFQIEARSADNGIAIHYDMAATSATEHFPGLATFHARFRSEPRGEVDPFRAALQSWYARDPDWAMARSPKHGLWLPFTGINTIAGAEDFHFSFFEKVGSLGEDVDAAHAAGVMTFAYTEPWLYWLPLNDSSKWNRRAAVDRMQEISASGFGKDRDFASAGFLGASRDADLNPRITFLNTPWSNGGRMEVNTDPELPVNSNQTINRAMAEWRYVRSVITDPRVDGIYLDSMSAMETIDYNAQALRVADYPATFVLGDLKPGIAMPIQAVEFTSALGSYLKEHGKYLMGNFPCWKFPFFMPYIDVPGEETTWYSGDRFTPLSDRELNYRRAMSGQKPFGFLQAAHFEQLTEADMEKYFRECLFFAFMPSFFSHDGANDPYWVDPTLYERDRPLFRKYLPLTIRLSEAGWQPVPSLRTDSENLRFEQFGAAGDDTFYITIRKTGGSDQPDALHLNAAAGQRIAYDMFTGRTKSIGPRQELSIFLASGEITCLALTRPDVLPSEISKFQASISNDLVYASAVENLSSINRELEAGLTCVVAQVSPVVEGDPIGLQISIKNSRKQPVTFIGIEGGTTQATSVEISPGASFVADIPGSVQRDGDGWIRLAWQVDLGDGIDEFARVFRPETIAPFAVSAPSSRVHCTDDVAVLDYSVDNRGSRSQSVQLLWSRGVHGGTQSVEIAAGETSVFQLKVAKAGPGAEEVRATIAADQNVIHHSSTYVVFTPLVRHLGMEEGVRISADSAYSGYAPATLNDGVVEPAGLNWNEAAFATAETTEPHWIRYDFPSACTVSNVIAHWNREGGVTYASRCGEVWAMLDSGELRKVGDFVNDTPTPKTVIAFPPVSATRIELRQPSSCGSRERPGLLWVTELEAE